MLALPYDEKKNLAAKKAKYIIANPAPALMCVCAGRVATFISRYEWPFFLHIFFDH